MATMQEITEALKAQKEKATKNTNNNVGDGASYPFWEIEPESVATIRFLPDNDKKNVFFWTKKLSIKLPFDGVVGGDYPTNNPVTVTVPCVEQWGDVCPIITATRPMWKDPAKEAIARLYWRKQSYIFQGFVVSSPFEEKNVPQNPIRRFVINPSIFELIEKSLMDNEIENTPTDYIDGLDFKIRKTQKGKYANYTTSEWSRRTRSLGVDEMAAIEEFGLFTLSDYLGKRPDASELDVIKAMFEDSLAGNPFDFDAYGKYYRPYGDRNSENGAQTVSRAVSNNTVKEEEAEEVAKPVANQTAAVNANEIIARIKNRTQSRT